MFRNYFKTAIRNLLRNKVYSFINIAGLSLGLACCLLIFLYSKDELSYDRFQKIRKIYTGSLPTLPIPRVKQINIPAPV